MNITELIAPDVFRKFTEQMECANRALHEAALRFAVPQSSAFAETAARLALPTPELDRIVEQTSRASQVVAELAAHLLPQADRVSSALAETAAHVAIWESQLRRMVEASGLAVFLNSERFIAETQAAAQRFAEFERDCANGAERLARTGWTLPISLTIPDMIELLRVPDEEIDDAFIAAYDAEDGFSWLKNGILTAARLKDWQPLLPQCLENFENGNYAICIPALLSVLEGAIARPDGVLFVSPADRVAYFRAKIAAADTDSLDRATWNSMNIFFASLYEKSDFRTAPPPKINRHWILHGRDLPSSWDRADALRLFHALTTLCTLYE
jgi:hypothetical protein